MESCGQNIVNGWRIAILAILFLLGVVFLALSLHSVQVDRFFTLTQDQQRQSIRRVQVPGARGRILDRNGVLLAGNRASFCIAYYVEELRKRGRWGNTIKAVDEDIDRLAAVLGVARTLSYATVSNHVMQSLPMPLLAWRDVDKEILARWAEAREPFPGVDVYVQPERYYTPEGVSAAHVLGYVGRDRPKPLPGQKIHFYLPEMLGKGGIEGYYNAELTGVSGGHLIRVDARGYKHDLWEGEEASSGEDVVLTLDTVIQQRLEQLLQPYRGAGVVLDPRNGEVLAMVSMPAYNPNAFVPVMPAKTWQELNADPHVPLFNRAIQGWYAPGSTFKPVTAMAAFLSGTSFDPLDIYTCDGVFKLGTMRLRCWDVYGHGSVGLLVAMERSCNSYFCHLGHAMGYEAIRSTAEQIGIGARTGIDLPGESTGLLPTPEWKERRLRDRWRMGDTCQIAIGQGLLITTPLQMAQATAVIANGGKVYRPHLVRGVAQDQLLRELNWPLSAVKQVQRGMHEVVHGRLGTGRRVMVPGLEAAAKTGTAEVDVAGVRRKNTWVTAYAPFENPEVAIAVIVEDGVTGGVTVAPLVRDLLKTVFRNSLGAEALEAVADKPGEVRGD